MSMGLAVTRQARSRPDELAVFDQDRRRTWRELDERTNRLANALRDRYGVRAGDRVALLCPNRIEVAEVLAATHKAGAVYVGLNFRMAGDDLDGALDNASPRLLIGAGEFTVAGRELADRHGIAWLDLDDADDGGYERVIAAQASSAPPTLPAVGSADDACIVYTSGTTGKPKGVLFSHAAMIQHATVTCLEFEISARSRYLVQIPHNSSVNITIAPCLVIGAALGFADNRNFDPERFAGHVRAEQVSHTFLVPTQLMRILDRFDAPSEEFASLTTLGYGSSPISPDRLGQLIDVFGPIFIQLYGMAEIASIGTLLRKQDHIRAKAGRPELLRSAGQPSLAVDVRVIDDDGAEVQPGQRGEVVFAGPHVMTGYYRDPERTAEVLTDGWMHSGDIAEVDQEGYLSIVDRRKNLIIRGGQNIVPTDIENVLFRHPAVLEAAVVGAPDPQWGERIVAVIALRPGARADPGELGAHAASQLPAFTRPEEIQIVPALPKNAVGKIDKQAVRAQFWAGDRKV
jgi:acyl-CoA synthetase (AMP-forming)/AMP-acid ligase II